MTTRPGKSEADAPLATGVRRVVPDVVMLDRLSDELELAAGDDDAFTIRLGHLRAIVDELRTTRLELARQSEGRTAIAYLNQTCNALAHQLVGMTLSVTWWELVLFPWRWRELRKIALEAWDAMRSPVNRC